MTVFWGWIGTLYFCAAVVAAVFLLRYANRQNVNSMLSEMVWVDFNPLCILLPLMVLFCWPIFFWLDYSRWIPMRRQERIAVLKKQRDEQRRIREEKTAYLSVVGLTGIAEYDLRYRGKVRIGDKVWGAVSMDGYISKGDPVVVVGRQGASLKVRKN